MFSDALSSICIGTEKFVARFGDEAEETHGVLLMYSRQRAGRDLNSCQFSGLVDALIAGRSARAV
jgi:hypothetical protein